MTPRSGPGGLGSGPRGPKTTPRAPQERPGATSGGQKTIKNELRLSAGPREPSGSHFGAIFEPPGSHFGAILEGF